MKKEDMRFLIHVDYSKPGFIMIREKEWKAFLALLEEDGLPIVQFTEDESHFMYHDQGACGNACPICAEEYAARLEHETN